MPEVKSAMLQSFEGGKAVLLLVDEDYEIHTLTANVNMLRFIIQNSELPNFRWRHSTSDNALRVIETGKDGYRSRASGGDALGLLRQYEKKKASA